MLNHKGRSSCLFFVYSLLVMSTRGYLKISSKFKKRNYFFLIGLNELPLHFLHFTLPVITLNESVLIFELQSLHIKMFLNNLACAAAIFAMVYYSFLFIIFCASLIITYSTWSSGFKSFFTSSKIGIS